MDKSAVILAGGSSSRFGQDKNVLELSNKPLLRHVVDAVDSVVDEVIVVTKLQEQNKKYSEIVPETVRFIVDKSDLQGPLIGALAGFEVAQGKYTLLLPSDSPFISPDIVLLLFELCYNKTAAIPRWPNQQVEPLHAVYDTKSAIEAAKVAVTEGKTDMHSMIEKLRGVRYVSTMVLEQLDPEMRTFFNVNTPLDLKKAEMTMKPKKTRKSK